MSAGNHTAETDWFVVAKKLMCPESTEGMVARAHTAAREAVLQGSERVRAVDAGALGEAAFLAAQASNRSLLKDLNEFNAEALCCEDLDRLLADLLELFTAGVAPMDLGLPVDFGPVGGGGEREW